MTGELGDHELDDEEQAWIREKFDKDMVPKLRKYHARVGLLNCGFAGDQYKSWNIRFESAGSDFDIVDFEYDEEGADIELD